MRLEKYGAYAICRNILLGKEEGYDHIYALAAKKGEKALDLTLEGILKQARADPEKALTLFNREKSLVPNLLLKRQPREKTSTAASGQSGSEPY